MRLHDDKSHWVHTAKVCAFYKVTSENYQPSDIKGAPWVWVPYHMLRIVTEGSCEALYANYKTAADRDADYDVLAAAMEASK